MIDENSLASGQQLIDAGLVLGIDVGCSPTRRSTCFCTLSWDATSIRLQFRLTTSDQEEHRRALEDLVGGARVDGVAIDGPLANGFRLVRNYRSAEAILSRGVLQKRGKPGQTSVPVGQNLHSHATRLAEIVARTIQVQPSAHPEAIYDRCIVEAFPNIYLAALMEEARIPALSRNASDVYWTFSSESRTCSRSTSTSCYLVALWQTNCLQFAITTIARASYVRSPRFVSC